MKITKSRTCLVCDQPLSEMGIAGPYAVRGALGTHRPLTIACSQACFQTLLRITQAVREHQARERADDVLEQP